jgi:hypothetical protein
MSDKCVVCDIKTDYELCSDCFDDFENKFTDNYVGTSYQVIDTMAWAANRAREKLWERMNSATKEGPDSTAEKSDTPDRIEVKDEQP